MGSTGPLELPDGSRLGLLGIAGDSIVPQSLEGRSAGVESQAVLVPLEVSPDEIEEIPPDVDPLTGIPETGGTNNNLTLKLANNSEAPLLLDIDRNGRVEAWTDGIMIVRHLWGYSGESVVLYAVAPDGTRTDAAEITSYLDKLGLVLDVDGDGELMHQTDGAMIFRYLLGFSGVFLVHNVIGPGATRDTVEEVTAYLDELKSMTVTPPAENQAPVLEPVGDLEVMPGGRLEVQLQATDPDGDPIKFFLGNSSALPTGMLEGNGILVFTPTIDELGTYSFTIIASDGELEATEEVTLKVIPDTVVTPEPPAENQAPVLEPVGDLEVMPGGRLEVQLQATDPDGDPITFSLGNSSALPTGMLEGNGILVFTPTIDELGTYSFTIIASDGELEATEEVTLKVIPDTVVTPEPPAENQAPVLEPVGDLEVMPGGRLEVQLQATDPDGDPITFSLGNSSALPTGMLEGNGILVFTPTIDELGTYSFTIIASDGELEATEEVTLKVIPDTVTTTRISGTIQNTEEEPLASVPIELGDLQTVTAADGSFTIEITGTLSDDTLKVRGEEIAGDLTYPFVAEKLPCC